MRVHLDRFQGPGDQPGHALVHGPHRRVLGQQHGRIFFLDAQKRARLPDRLRDEITSSKRRHPLHRRVLQQPAPALRAGLSPAQRSPLWLSAASLGSVEETINSAVRNPRGSSHVAVEADPSTILGSHRPAVRVLITQDNPNTTTTGNESNTGNSGNTGNGNTGNGGNSGNGGGGVGLIEGHPDPVGPGTIDRHLCDSGSIPIMFDTDGQVVNVGRTLRLFTSRQRAGLAARDGGCMWPGCARPPSWTEAHHINEWFAKNGKTDIADGILLCKRDHLRLHNQGWIITRTGNDYWLTPPKDIDPAQTPIPLQSKTPLNLQSPVPPQNIPPAQAGHGETPPDGTTDGGNLPEAEHHLRAG